MVAHARKDGHAEDQPLGEHRGPAEDLGCRPVAEQSTVQGRQSLHSGQGDQVPPETTEERKPSVREGCVQDSVDPLVLLEAVAPVEQMPQPFIGWAAGHDTENHCPQQGRMPDSVDLSAHQELRQQGRLEEGVEQPGLAVQQSVDVERLGQHREYLGLGQQPDQSQYGLLCPFPGRGVTDHVTRGRQEVPGRQARAGVPLVGAQYPDRARDALVGRAGGVQRHPVPGG